MFKIIKRNDVRHDTMNERIGMSLMKMFIIEMLNMNDRIEASLFYCHVIIIIVMLMMIWDWDYNARDSLCSQFPI